MIVWMLMSMLSDAVFDSAAGSQQSYTNDFTRYLRRRGFKARRPLTPTSSH